ncbi:hypothetical protein [Vibrio sp. Hal054]
MAAALITQSENELLVSDIVVKDLTYSSAEQFALAATQKVAKK